VRFLASIRFTLLLIALLLLYVIGATLVESITQSHQRALLLAYQQPTFLLLLLGLFLNILLSALRRWPWKKKHLPFLCAHLGLLMIISGVAIKQVWGVQGVILLAEGGGTNTLLLPNTYAVYIEGRDGQRREIVPFEMAPHCEVSYTGWIKNGMGEIAGLPPIPVGEELSLGPWRVKVERCSTVEQWSPVAGPTVVLLEEESGKTHLMLVGKAGKVDHHPFGPEPLYAIDGGFGGYEVALPFDSARLTASEAEWRQRKLESLALLGGEPFAALLDLWDRSGKALYPKDQPLPEELELLMLEFPWHQLPESLRRGIGWCSLLLEDLSLDQIIPHLEQHQWPIEGCKTAAQVCAAILNIGESLPPIPPPAAAAERLHQLSAYFLANEMHLTQMADPPWPEPTSQIATRLGRKIELLPRLKKSEENRPLASVIVDGEKLLLPYEPLAMGLRWPMRNGKHLLRFEPKQLLLPHRIRLQDARQINYPGTNQPYAYEADLWIGERYVTLSMNHVYETRDGYRFYLSSLTPADESAVQRIQLTVNRDPARWKLTYPGCLILVLGVLLLYPKLRRRA
jgi:hypothetical protein